MQDDLICFISQCTVAAIVETIGGHFFMELEINRSQDRPLAKQTETQVKIQVQNKTCTRTHQ